MKLLKTQSVSSCNLYAYSHVGIFLTQYHILTPEIRIPSVLEMEQSSNVYLYVVFNFHPTHMLAAYTSNNTRYAITSPATMGCYISLVSVWTILIGRTKVIPFVKTTSHILGKWEHCSCP